jgi:hypothetical protein
MDQRLLDASQFRIHSLSLDTRFATTYYPPTALYNTNTPTCEDIKPTGDIQYRLNAPIRNVMRIALSSVELPEVEYLFSARHGNLTFAIADASGAKQSFEIPEGNYTADQLVTEINGLISAWNASMTATLDDYSGKLTITHSGGKPFVFYGASDNAMIAARFKEWGLGYNLGFRKRVVESVAGVVEGVAVVRIQPAPYYLLQLLIPDQVEAITHQLPGGGSVPAFAKVVLRESWYYLQFDDNSNFLRKEYTFLTPVNLSTIRMRLLDAYGDPVDIHDMDWSATLEIYEVTNAKQYNAIGYGYARN